MNKLRVWHTPQVPMNAFYVEVASVAEGVKMMKVLASYDLFQLENKIKPDYSNAQGLQMLEDGAWVDWYDADTGIDDPEEYLEDIGCV